MSGIKILKASYGNGTTNVDVTAAVASHIKDGTLSLVVTPDSLSVQDPAPGQQKTLDVSYTINNGNTNGQMVKDNEMLLINAPPERKAVGLEIIKAEYGYAGNFTDVTDAVQTHVKNGSIDLKVSASAVGIPDPNPNKQKMLSVEYSINGSKNMGNYKDGESFKLSAPPEDQVDNKTPSQHVLSVMGAAYKGIGYFVLMFLYILSIYTCSDLGITIGFSPILMGGIGAVIPFVAFWGLPIIFFFRRLFSTTDLVV
jgi:hypothetical protein